METTVVLLLIALTTALFLGLSILRKRSRSMPASAVVKPLLKRSFLHHPNISRQQVRRMYADEMPQNSWEEFEVFVHEVQPDFFPSLRKELPTLTVPERQLCGLIYLGRSTKEMAHLLQERPERVKLARTRLRRKLKIADQMSLYQGLQLILFRDTIQPHMPSRLAA